MRITTLTIVIVLTLYSICACAVSVERRDCNYGIAVGSMAVDGDENLYISGEIGEDNGILRIVPDTNYTLIVSNMFGELVYCNGYLYCFEDSDGYTLIKYELDGTQVESLDLNTTMLGKVPATFCVDNSCNFYIVGNENYLNTVYKLENGSSNMTPIVIDTNIEELEHCNHFLYAIDTKGTPSQIHLVKYNLNGDIQNQTGLGNFTRSNKNYVYMGGNVFYFTSGDELIECKNGVMTTVATGYDATTSEANSGNTFFAICNDVASADTLTVQSSIYKVSVHTAMLPSTNTYGLIVFIILFSVAIYIFRYKPPEEA